MDQENIDRTNVTLRLDGNATAHQKGRVNLNRALSLVAASFFLPLVACTDVGTVRVGPAVPARPDDCALELIDSPPQAGIPPGKELLGYVRVIHEAGRGPNDPEVLKMVKPEACKLGGEQVSVGMSSNFSNGLRRGSSLTYMVWRRKQKPAGPMKF